MKFVPYRYLRLKLAARGLLPPSMLARVTAYLVGIDLILLLLRGVLSLFGRGSSLDGWIRGLATVAGFCGFFLLLRFVRRRLIWRLRNRLIVTYVFIGVIPVVLLITMAGLAGYFLAGQFATFLATSDLHAEITALGTANNELAAHLAAELKDGIPTERAAAILRPTEPLDPESPRRVLSWYRGSGVLVQRGAEAPAEPGSLPAWLEKELQNGDFKDFVMNDGRLRLRAGRSIAIGRDRVIAVSSVPVTNRFVTRIAAGIGVVAVYGSDRVATRRREVAPGTHPPSIEINGETIAN